MVTQDCLVLLQQLQLCLLATAAAFQALYDVTDEEREAIRRFAAQWSKNSTLLPIKDKETGDFKYVDFSHANAYDTLIRPLQTVVNAVQDGKQTTMV